MCFLLTLGHLAIHFFEISWCQYNIDTVLADGKIGIRDLMHWLADGNVSIKSVLVSGTRCHCYHQIISGKWAKTAKITEDFTHYWPNTDPMPILPMAVNAKPNIEYHHRLQLVPNASGLVLGIFRWRLNLENDWIFQLNQTVYIKRQSSCYNLWNSDEIIIKLVIKFFNFVAVCQIELQKHSWALLAAKNSKTSKYETTK